MTDPLGVNCPAGTWTKVATDVVNAVIWLISGAPGRYYITHRDTGAAAPTDLTDAIGFDTIDEEGSFPSMPVSAAAGVDVYIWPTKAAGRVRVDAGVGTGAGAGSEITVRLTPTEGTVHDVDFDASASSAGVVAAGPVHLRTTEDCWYVWGAGPATTASPSKFLAAGIVLPVTAPGGVVLTAIKDNTAGKLQAIELS